MSGASGCRCWEAGSSTALLQGCASPRRTTKGPGDGGGGEAAKRSLRAHGRRPGMKRMLFTCRLALSTIGNVLEMAARLPPTPPSPHLPGTAPSPAAPRVPSRQEAPSQVREAVSGAFQPSFAACTLPARREGLPLACPVPQRLGEECRGGREAAGCRCSPPGLRLPAGSLRGFRCSARRVRARAARWGGGRCQSGARCVVLKHFRGSRNLSQPATAPPSDNDVILGVKAVGRAAVPHV